MTIHYQYNADLSQLNSLGFSQRAECLAQVDSEESLEAALAFARQQQWPVTVLGAGSNIILGGDLPGLTLQLTMHDVRYVTENHDSTRVYVGAGLNWQSLVTHTLDQGLRGLENLTLIPGCVGAAPIQNIGAYGVEVSERIISVRALHIHSGQWHEFSATDCAFSYRNSLFKTSENHYVITEVGFRLGNCHPLQYNYATLNAHLEAQQCTQPTAQQISDAVAAVRRSRLPDPAQLGNAGSFFHNPVIDSTTADSLRQRYPELPLYPVNDHQYKAAAGWLIEHLGYKGIRRGPVGVFDQQALVLVHHGGGNATQLMALADEIQASVMAQFGLVLEIEPRRLGLAT